MGTGVGGWHHSVPWTKRARARFAAAPVGVATEARSDTRIVVFNLHGAWLAAIVSAVREVMAVEASSILPALADCSGLSVTHLLGTVTHRDVQLLVLDMAKVLTASELLSLQELQQRVA